MGGLPADPTTDGLPNWPELPRGGVSEDAGARVCLKNSL
jgi:hypothetical protein